MKNWISALLIYSFVFPLIVTSIFAVSPPQADIVLTLNSTTNRIRVIYTPPNSSACTVEVSENPSYTPVVNDVNATLFSGANSDARTGTLGSGTTGQRTFFAGTVQQPNGLAPLVAGDAKIYSRALQVNTTHYIRVTCGTHTGTGSIATKNIPLGKTWAEPRPIVSAGVVGMPTVDPTNRDVVLIDPQIGTKITRTSIVGDKSYIGGSDTVAYSENGAQYVYQESPTKITDGLGGSGYLEVALTQQAFTRLYWFDTTTGISRHLGYIRMGAGLSGFSTAHYYHVQSAMFDNSDPTKMYNIFIDDSGDTRVLKCQLPAANNTYYRQSVPEDASTTANCTWTDLTSSSSLTAKMVAFNAAYDKTKYAAFFYQNVQGDYIHFTAARGQQNTYGWQGVYKISTNSVVALMSPMKNGNGGTTSTRWCGYHTSMPARGSIYPSWEMHNLIDGSGAGAGPCNVALSGAINNSQTTLTLSTNTPTCATVDDGLGPFQDGDEILIDPNTGSQELVKLVSHVGTTWTVTRGISGSAAFSHANAAVVTAGCNGHSPSDYTNAAIWWWDFLNDPNGNDTTGTKLIAINDGVNGHAGWSLNRKIGSGWLGCQANEMVACSPTLTFTNSPAFNSVTKNAGGNAWMMHAAPPHQSYASAGEQVWGLDFIHPYTDPDMDIASSVNVTGSLYKITLTSGVLDIKNLIIQAWAGPFIMQNISSPTTGNVIGGTSTDNYKYCIAYKINECRTGSTVGSIYANGPNLSTGSTCPPFIARTDITSNAFCITNLPGSGGQNLRQIGIIAQDTIGKYQRTLTQGLSSYKGLTTFANGQVTPDGKWVSFLVTATDGNYDIWNVLVPPFPSYDGIDRNTFITKTISVPAGGGSATKAYIRGGYDSNLFCKEYSDKCVFGAGGSPYAFETADSLTPTACTSGCNIDLKVVPDHIMMYQVVYLDNSNAIVSTSALSSVIDDSAPVGGGSGIVRCNWHTDPKCAIQ